MTKRFVAAVAQGCRVPAVERLLLAGASPKRIILVLNKIDLVPAEIARQWLHVLRREYPTVAFKASTQSQVRAPSCVCACARACVCVCVRMCV